MNEYDRIWGKYEDEGLLEGLESLEDVNRLALRSLIEIKFPTSSRMKFIVPVTVELVAM